MISFPKPSFSRPAVAGTPGTGPSGGLNLPFVQTFESGFFLSSDTTGLI